MSFYRISTYLNIIIMLCIIISVSGCPYDSTGEDSTNPGNGGEIPECSTGSDCGTAVCNACNNGKCVALTGNQCNDDDACTISDTCSDGECMGVVTHAPLLHVIDFAYVRKWPIIRNAFVFDATVLPYPLSAIFDSGRISS